MDLFSLSYRIQQDRYRVAPEAVAEAIIRWHQRLSGESDASVEAPAAEPAPADTDDAPAIRLSPAATGEPSR